MLCSSCGKTIPFSGKVCPYCQRDKFRDQAYAILAPIIGLGTGWIGAQMFDVLGAIGGFFVGCTITYAVVMSLNKSSAPEVKVVNSPSPIAPPPKTDGTEARLRKLKQLFDSGLIEREEYEQKRQEILREL